MNARSTAAVLLAPALALAVSSCAAPTESASEQARHATASAVARGHAYVQEKQYDKAIDTFVELAGDEGVRRQAVGGASDALLRKASTQRVPQRIRSALALAKRLPASDASREQLASAMTTLLVDPVHEQAKQAQTLLENRRAFIERMRDEDEADVLPSPERVLTEQEVIVARQQLPELRVSPDVEKLYRFDQPLAAAMDRFVADDERYLGQEEVTNEQLDELELSCDALGDALWPVQRQLDRLRPGWRRE